MKWVNKGHEVVICSERHQEVLANQMADLGYFSDKRRCLMNKQITTNCTDFDIAHNINTAKYIELVPAQAITPDGIAKLRKLSNFSILNQEKRNSSLAIKTFDIPVTERCTLRCENCCDLMQYYQHPVDADVLEIKRDFDAFMANVDFVDYVHVFGGEPFLYDKLCDVLDYIYHQSPNANKIGLIEIVTNGTIVPNIKIIESILRNNVRVLISNYGKLSRRIGELVKILSAYNVAYEVLNIKFWSNIQQFTHLHAQTHEQKFKDKICIVGCKFLKKGKFYLCSFLPEGENLNLFPHDPENSLGIYGTEFSKEKLSVYLSKNAKLPGCSWCSGASLEQMENNLIPAAIQTGKPIEYKRFGDECDNQEI